MQQRNDQNLCLLKDTYERETGRSNSGAWRLAYKYSNNTYREIEQWGMEAGFNLRTVCLGILIHIINTRGILDSNPVSDHLSPCGLCPRYRSESGFGIWCMPHAKGGWIWCIPHAKGGFRFWVLILARSQSSNQMDLRK